MRSLVIFFGALALAACPAPPADDKREPEPELTRLVSEDIGTPVSARIGASGGVLETTQDGVTYRLFVAGGALEEDTDLALTPARLVGVKGSVGARFEPDGLQFLAPATLTITPAPEGDVLVALQDGAVPVEAAIAIPTPNGVILPVAHFSTHAAADAEAAQNAFPTDVLLAVRDLKGLPRDAMIAIAIGIYYRTHVEPQLPLSARDVHGFDIATAAALPWLATVAGSTNEARALPHERDGTETAGQLAARVSTDLVAAGLELYGRVSPPLCSGTPDILGVLDWGLKSVLLQSKLGALGTSVTPATCLTSHVRVEGPESMTPTTRDLNFSFRFEVQGPEADPRVVTSDANFSVQVLGATGPDNVAEENGGDARNVAYVREPGPDRSRVVTLEVAGQSPNAQLEAIPTAPPAIFVVTEEGTGATLTATPAQIASPGETSQVCISVVLDDEPVTTFTALYAHEGPGALSDDFVPTTTGSACVTYTAPSPLPSDGKPITVRAQVAIGGGVLHKSVAIPLGAGALELDVVANPASADADGQVLEVCGTLTTQGMVVEHYDIQFSLFGPGTLSETSVIGVSSVTGEACVQWTAPTPLVVGESATVSAHVTRDGLSADDSVLIPFVAAGPPPLYLGVSLFSEFNEPCGNGPLDFYLVGRVEDNETEDALAGVTLSLFFDGAAVGGGASDANGEVRSDLFSIAQPGAHSMEIRTAQQSRVVDNIYVGFTTACGTCATDACGRLEPTTIEVCDSSMPLLEYALCRDAAICACQTEGCRADYMESPTNLTVTCGPQP